MDAQWWLAYDLLYKLSFIYIILHYSRASLALLLMLPKTADFSGYQQQFFFKHAFFTVQSKISISFTLACLYLTYSTCCTIYEETVFFLFFSFKNLFAELVLSRCGILSLFVSPLDVDLDFTSVHIRRKKRAQPVVNI